MVAMLDYSQDHFIVSTQRSYLSLIRLSQCVLLPLGDAKVLVVVEQHASYHRVFFGVVLRDGDVVVGDFAYVRCLLLSIPHDVVQVWKVVIQIDSLKGVSSFSPAGQLRALQWTV